VWGEHWFIRKVTVWCMQMSAQVKPCSRSDLRIIVFIEILTKILVLLNFYLLKNNKSSIVVIAVYFTRQLEVDFAAGQVCRKHVLY